MKKRCRNCKYWSATNKEVYGSCANEHFIYHSDVTPFQYKKEIGLNSFVYWDSESYGADFSPGPEFSCIHWEEREEIK